MFNKSTITNLSITNKFNLDEKTLVTINSLSLEDLIAAKLEVTAKSMNGKFFGLPIFNSIDRIIKYAILNFALSSSNSYAQAADILNMDKSNLRKQIKKFNLIKENKDVTN